MKNKEMTVMKKGLLAMLMAVMAFTFVGCGAEETQEVQEEVVQDETIQEEVKTINEIPAELGEGNTQFVFEVIDLSNKITTCIVNTDALTVGEALLAVDLIAGSESEYGLYVDTVAGLTLDYDVDEAYWAFFINGDMASAGVDTTDVAPGSTYTFIADAAY